MVKAGELLKEFLRRQGVSGNEPAIALFRGWAQLVEPPLLDHSRIVDLKNEILWVEVDHPGWMQLLHLQQARILKQLRHRYPQLKVRGLSCRVNLRFSQAVLPAAPAAAEPPPSGAGGEEAVQAVSEVQEPELRGLLDRLFRQVLERMRRKAES